MLKNNAFLTSKKKARNKVLKRRVPTKVGPVEHKKKQVKAGEEKRERLLAMHANRQRTHDDELWRGKQKKKKKTGKAKTLETKQHGYKVITPSTHAHTQTQTNNHPTHDQGYSPIRSSASDTLQPVHHHPAYSTPSNAAQRTWSWDRCAGDPGWPSSRD